MALDHLKLELLFNVIAITAVTSLTLIWYLRKRDRETLVNRMSLLRQAAAARVQPAKPQEDPPLALPGVNPDIRQFVSGRATGWMAPSVAQWNQRLTPNGEPSPQPEAEQKELPRSQGIVFPRREASGPGVPRLAGPVELCGHVRAAKYGRLSC
jgi:hypothetical protein